ncbi:MAG: ABC transporter ATP-binding protein [Bacteroidota bacterium]
MQALKNVSLTMGQGMFGLLGQNGAGKSTLMRTVATLQDADNGSVEFNGIDVFNDPAALRQRLGYLPQEFGVYPNVTARELLLHLADLKGITRKSERVELVGALLEKVNLYDKGNNKLSGYSGGMKQRFGIAQALLGDPELIIVDEPTAGLDPMERNRFYNLLAELGENKVVLLSTHIVEDVKTLCQDMAVIGQGEVLLTGKPEEIEGSLAGKLWEVEIERDDLVAYQRDFRVISSRFNRGKLLVTVLAEDSPNVDFLSKTPSLEDAYFNLVTGQSLAVNA